jgi:hypothetical protein
MVPLSSAEGHGTLWRVLEGVFSKRDHEFESAFLQRRVGCEPGPGYLNGRQEALPTRPKDKIRAGSEAPIDLIRSAHDRSAVRAGAACSVRTAGAIDGSSVVGVFANHRSSIGSSTACPIYTIGANYRIRMMGYSEPAENDDDRERIFPHDCLPVASPTMLR